MMSILCNVDNLYYVKCDNPGNSINSFCYFYESFFVLHIPLLKKINK